MSRFDARYTRFAIALHWLVAVLVVVQIAWGWAMQEIPKQPPGLRADAFNAHKSIGATIFLLMVVRLAWRWTHRPPALPFSMPAWQRRAARANHAVLYAALFVMPIAGYLGSVFSGYPVRLYGMTMPAWGWRDEAIKSAMSLVHLAASWALVAAIAAHVAAALKHAWIDRDGLMQRMLPGRTRDDAEALSRPRPREA